jgi:hypothetical protein
VGKTVDKELLGTESSPEAGMVLGGGLAGELLGRTESSPEAGVVLGRGLVGELFGRTSSSPEAGVVLGRGVARELLGMESLPEVGMVVGMGLASELEAGIELELVFCRRVWFPLAAKHFGSRSADVAGPGPSVIATQPGRYGMGPVTSSLGSGLGAAHEFISSSELKRFPSWNTAQFWITPEGSVQLSIAR